MPLNKTKGNMYEFVTHTWNPIKGRCQHDCTYCYMKPFVKNKPLRMAKRELKTNLGEGNFIFVGSSTDMWAENVPDEWIRTTLEKCRNYQGNKYLFQSKNPFRFEAWIKMFPTATILGATIESNQIYPISTAPPPLNRKIWMEYLGNMDTMITIEPIMKFDLDVMVSWIQDIRPLWVNIGADSKGHGIPEPTWKEIQELVDKLKPITEVKLKSNLKRLGGKQCLRKGQNIT